MTFSRIKPLGWSVNEKLTSTQMNSLDTDHANALDKTVAGDSLAGKVTLTGVGRIVETVVTGANADTTYYTTSGRVILVTNSVSTYRVYTLSDTNAVAGDTITIMATSAFGYWINVLDSVSSLELCKIGHALDRTTYLSATFMFDGTRWRIRSGVNARGIRYQEFTSSTTWECPQDVRSILVYGFGGGGGGGNGDDADNSTSTYANGGSGGGGAVAAVKRINVTPGTTYTITIGAGGTYETDGSATTIGVSPSISAAFYGGGAGCRATAFNTTTTFKQWCVGGSPSKCEGRVLDLGSGTTDATIRTLASYVAAMWNSPSTGGYAFSDSSFVGGQSSIEGYDGGTGGDVGSTSGSYKGGGGGGGGGGGPAGNGANGGTGGNGNNAGSATNGANGSSASANTGAGGGGGGGGGFGSGGGGIGGTGGSGGSGFLAIWY